MNLEASAFKKTGTSVSALTLTGNDVKILGKLLEKKREKSLPTKQFHTRLFKTHNSNWTPVVHKPSNDKIFTERLELITNWFDMWTALQRRDFFDIILLHCTKKQLFYIQNWFNERVPLRHLDFTTVLPRFLSLYIFSYLDPRSLSRASMVSWQWKFLTEQNILWTPKCLRHGWFLPFNPSPFEFGTWKHHYVACLMSMDAEAGGAEAGALTVYKAKKGSTSSKLLKSAKGDTISARKALRLLWPELGKEILDARPPWLPTDRIPHDIEKTQKAFLAGFNPNDPRIHPSLLLYHTQFGTWKSQLRQSAPALVRMRLLESARNSDHHLLQENIDPELEHVLEAARAPLSRSLQLQNFEERRLMELQGMTSEPPMPSARLSERRSDLSGGTQYQLPWSKCSIESRSKKTLVHPRIILISSRVAASEMLVDASLCDVIPIAYDYEGATLESLLHRLDRTLQGRQARSIGIFPHVDGPGRLCLLRDINVTANNLQTTPDLLHFFKKVATHVKPGSDGGHVDLFAPLHACESGTELITNLNLHAGMVHSAPSGVARGYNYINSEWVLTPEGAAPAVLYFCREKLSTWMNIADHVDEACRALSTHVRKYFGQSSRDVIAKVVGQIVFDATGLAKIGDVESISQALVDGLVQAGQEHSVRDPFQSLGNYFLNLSRQKQKTSQILSADADDIFAGSYHPNDGDVLLRDLKRDDVKTVAMDKVDSSMATKMESDDEEEEMNEEKSRDALEVGETRKNHKLRDSDLGDTRKSASGLVQNVSFKSYSDQGRDLEISSLWKETIGSYGNRIGGVVDRREAIAREILSSELDYMRTLEVIQKVFYVPCEAALAANRAIISAPNLQLIFNDVLLLLQLSSDLLSDLQFRLSSWHGQQCLGDVFVKFTLKLKAYTNFLKVYPLVLRTIEKCVEQGPLFRAFLKRHERTAASKMLTLPELLLAPSQRIVDYISLLTSYQHQTSFNHVDSTDVETALNRFNELNQLIQQCKLRGEQERHLVAVQKKIIKCPILLEANRFFIKQMDVSGLQSPSTDVIRELRVYRHVENLGLFLFNDSLIVTKRTVKHLPFERSKEEVHVFVECCQLIRLRVEDIPDSKYVLNAFRMYTPKREWFCSIDSPEEKLEWISILEKTIRTALEDVD